MTPASVFIDTEHLPWRELPVTGITWKKLRFDPASGASTVLLKFAPGARYLAHAHPAGEEYYVLEGTLRDGANTWGAGAYVRHPPGSRHAPSSDDGCLVLVILPAPIEVLEVG